MDEREYGRRKPMKMNGATVQCMPRLWRKGATGGTPASIQERFREVVFKLIMLSAVSKNARTRRAQQQPSPGGSSRQHLNDPDSYRSEAVEDCIEFFKRSAAEGAKSSTTCEEALEVGFTTSLQVM